MAAAGISPARWCCQSGLDFSRETTSQTREWGDISHPHGNGAAYGALQRRCCEIFSISVSMPSLPSRKHMGRRADGQTGYIRALQAQVGCLRGCFHSRALPLPSSFVVRSLHTHAGRNGLDTGCHMNSRLPAPAAGGRRPFTRALPWAAAALCKDNGPELTGLHERDKMRTGRKIHPSGFGGGGLWR